MSNERFIAKENQAAALAFIRSPLWLDMKRAALVRRPPSADPMEPPHQAAARGFQRDAWEKALDALEALPFEQPEVATNPFNRPAVTDTAD